MVQYVSRMSTAACASLDLTLNKILLSGMYSAGWCLAAGCVLGTRTIRVVGVLAIDEVEWYGPCQWPTLQGERETTYIPKASAQTWPLVGPYTQGLGGISTLEMKTKPMCNRACEGTPMGGNIKMTLSVFMRARENGVWTCAPSQSTRTQEWGL